MYEQDLLQTTDRDQIIATLNKMAVHLRGAPRATWTTPSSA